MVVVDDHAAASQILGEMVDSTPGLRLEASLGSGEDAVAFATATATGPHLVVLDVRMPGLGGVRAARLIADANAAHVIVLVSSEEEVGLTLTTRPGLQFVPKSRLTGAWLLAAWRERYPG